MATGTTLIVTSSPRLMPYTPAWPRHLSTFRHSVAKPSPNTSRTSSPEKLGFAYMDRKEVMIGGSRSRVEFCDLFSKAKDIVHVKRYGGSSVLSHLFNQAIVSADCFLNEPSFRADVNKFLPTAYRLPNT